MRPRRPGRKAEGLSKNIQKALNPYVEEAEALSAEFIDWAKKSVGADLDYTIDSIRPLDKVCRFNKLAIDDGLVLRGGFLLGEMLRRTYKGRYQWDTRANALSLQIGDLTLFPIEKVRKIVEGEAATLEEYLMVLAKKIADQRGHGAR